MNVVFDIGNVLIHWDPRALYRQIFTSEDDVEWFLANVCTPDWNLEQDRGRSFDDAIAEATLRHPDHAEAIAAYHHRWHETIVAPIEGSIAVLQDLQRRAHPSTPSPTGTRTSSARPRPGFPSSAPPSATSWSRATKGW
jgi:2-haloacid dehalogenase